MPEQHGRANTVGRLLAVSVGRPQVIDRRGNEASTAIWKHRVDGPVRAEGVNLDGDDQADRNAHGGTDKAVYAYAESDRLWWEDELAREIERGGFGENLTIDGIDITKAVVGERWRIGSVVLEVSEPRVPCWKLNHRMEDDGMVQRFTAAGRPGTYLRIIGEGTLEAGDDVLVASVPDHSLTVGDISTMYRDRSDVERLLAVDQVSDAWQAWATRTIERR